MFARFLEDNELIGIPLISGPGDRLPTSSDEYELYFREHPHISDRNDPLDLFAGLGALPGGESLFGKHNMIHSNPGWLSGDAAREMLKFFQWIDPASGELVHDFTDPQWDTRFLGALYQDFSESVRKKYALLQTPDPVVEAVAQ